MSGEKKLETILKTISPFLLPHVYVFCTVPSGKYGDFLELNPFASVVESEGLTLIVPMADAVKASLQFEGSFRCITLRVHSSLESVGLTAAVSSRLAEHHISANIVAGFYHDHIFVPERHAEAAMSLLEDFTNTPVNLK